MQEQDKEITDWRTDISTEQKPILKVADGNTEVFTFLSDGDKFVSADYGTSILFFINHEDVEKRWFVNSENYSLLKQIKELGTLEGLKVKVSRKGSKKSDTKYTIIKI